MKISNQAGKIMPKHASHILFQMCSYTLKRYDLVNGFAEGVDRIYRDVQEADLPKPEYKQSELMLYVKLKNKTLGFENSSWESLTGDNSDSGQVSGQAGGQVSAQIFHQSLLFYKT